MAILVGLLTISLTLLFSTATVVPTPQSIGSDLSIITHNDLYGNLTTRHAASILLSTSFNYSVATSKCAALGTKLWDPQRHLEDLTFLRYLDYANAAYKAGVYWVSSNSTTNCTAVTAHAELAYYPCETYLPVLCFNAGNDRDRQVAIATNNARIIGLRERSSSSFRFLGITYASIPARFAHSTYYPPPPGSNITALDYSPQCIQSGCGVQGTPDCAEDCLTLNIWTPHLPNVDNATRKGKAVMVWIHGGGFTGGAASDTTFDGSAMASRGDVVLVTINYRLSTLGFLALSNTSLTGNYGLHDQSVALDWLRAHVEDFGGDKDRITVFGQSAGAASVRALLASPQARNKVCGAIMMSTPQGVEYASTFSGYLTIEEATNRTAAAIAEVGCTPLKGEDTVACLRKADPLALVGIRNVSQPSGTVARYPVVDGIFLTNATLPLGPTAPRFNIPIMSGIMRDDGSPFTSYPTWSNVSAVLSSQGFPASAILSSNSFPFPEGANSTLRIFNLTSRVATDVMFRCLAQSTAYTAAKNGVFKSVYSYEFDRAYQIEDWSPNPPACEAPVTEVYPFGDPNAPFYKCHSGELLSVFGNTIPQGRPLRDDDDIPFSQFIVDTWTAFARTGNPTPDEAFLMARGFTNTSKMVKTTGIWEPVNAAKPMLKVLDVRGRGKMEEFREGAQCEVLGQRLDYYDS